MKSNLVRAGIAAALVLALSACGGTEEYTVNGTVIGLTDTGLVLENNGKTIQVAPNATSFSFPDRIEYGKTYQVTAKAQPVHQECTVYRGNGTAGQMASIDIVVECLQRQYNVEGTITGLTADGLVLSNGSTGIVSVPKTGTLFIFPGVKDGSTYGITVLTQPTGQRCTVANGVGTMGTAKVTNVAVTCVPAT